MNFALRIVVDGIVDFGICLVYAYVDVCVYFTYVYVFVGYEYIGRSTSVALIDLMYFGDGVWLRLACVMDTAVTRSPSIVDKMSAEVLSCMTTCL